MASKSETAEERRKRELKVAAAVAFLVPAARRALVGTSNTVVRRYGSFDGSDMELVYHLTGDLGTHVESTLTDVYRLARAEGYKASRRDIAALSKTVDARGIASADGSPVILTPAPSMANDAAVAKDMAKRYADGVRSEIIKNASPDKSIAEVVRDAIEKRRPHLETIGETEAAATMNDERRRVVSETISKSGAEEALGFVYRRWNALFDSATCEECASMDGTTATYDGSFDGGVEPGNVHPRCRCFFDLVVK